MFVVFVDNSTKKRPSENTVIPTLGGISHFSKTNFEKFSYNFYFWATRR